MSRFWKSDAGAVVLYFVGTILLAATLFPWIYNGGLWLGTLARAGEVSGILEFIGEAAIRTAERGKTARFFSRTLLLSALLLAPLLFWRLRRTRGQRQGVGLGLQPLRPSGRKLAHLAAGVTISGGMLWIAGLCLAAAGAFVTRPDFETGELLGEALLPAIGASLVEEWLFRGLILGVWLRAQSARAAALGSSLLFAALHFMSPPPGETLENPGAAGAGFELLGHILMRFSDPRFFFAELVTLFILGLILAWTRLKTKSLWLPIGLHGGIVFAFKAFNMGFSRDDDSGVSTWWIGDGLRAGLAPLISLILMAAILAAFLRWDRKRSFVQPSPNS